jgi:ligand-binding SRPBCC domain-containing protein
MKHLFEQEQLVRRPRREVFAFFADAANLERITPGSLHFEIRSPQPIAMRAGATIDYTLSLFGLRFRWHTLIESFDPGSPESPVSGFVDVQTKGPYRSWRHSHTFSDAPGGTLVRDRVEYEMPFGPLGELARRLFVARQLRRIFAFRRAAIETAFA